MWKIQVIPDSPVVRTPASAAGGTDLIPGHKTKIPHAASKKERKKNPVPIHDLKKKKNSQ